MRWRAARALTDVGYRQLLYASSVPASLYLTTQARDDEAH